MTEAQEYNLRRVQLGQLSSGALAWLSGFYSVEQFQAATMLTPDGKVGPKTARVVEWHMKSNCSPGLLLDAARYQHEVDMGLLVERRVRGIYHKATQGLSYVDPRHKERVVEAGDAGLLFGSYHFAEPASPPTMQAEHFLATLGRGGLVPVLDMEGQGWTGPSAKRFCKAFLARMEKDDVPCVIYTGMGFLFRYMYQYRLGATLWVARYSRYLLEGRGVKLRKVRNHLAMWQYQDGGAFVAGVKRRNGQPGRIGVNMVMQDKFNKLLDLEVLGEDYGRICEKSA